MKRILLTGLALCLAFCAAGTSSALQPGLSDALLAANGVVYTVRAAQYGSLFPEGSAAAAEHRVLALSISDSLGQTLQQVIPGTEGFEIEVNPSVILEETTGTLYVLWESWYGVHSRLHLAGFTNGAWTEIIEITGSPYVVQSSPHFAVTRDQVAEYAEDGATAGVHQRTILHLFWIEERGGGEEKIAYAPQLLLDGELVSNVKPVILNDLLPASEGAPASLVEPASRPFMLRSGRDAQSVVVTFTDQMSRQLVSMEMRVLPSELSELVGEFGSWLNSSGGEPPADELAEAARRQILSSGSGINTSALADLADAVARCISGFDEETPPAAMVAPCTERILDAGFQLDSSGIKKIFGKARPQWIGVGYRPSGPVSDGPEQANQAQQHVATRVTAIHPTPEAMALRPTSILTSVDGESLVVYWTEATENGQERLVYQETLADGTWSAENRLDASAAGEEAAVRLLRDRLDSN